MRINSMLGCAIASAVLTANHTHAGVTATLIDRGIPTDGTSIASGFHAWVIRVASDNGNITGIDLETDGRGIFGPMVQRWTSLSNNGIYDLKSAVGTAQNLTPNGDNFDSHLLSTPPHTIPMFASEALGSGTFPPVGSSVGGGMPENTNSSGIGVSGPDGTIRSSAFGILDPSPTLTWDLAYIVLRNGELKELSGRITIATAGGTFDVVIPEPVLTILLPLLIGQRPRRKWQ